MASTRASTSKAVSDPDFVPLLIAKLNEMRTQANTVQESNICNKLTGMYVCIDLPIIKVNRIFIFPCFK